MKQRILVYPILLHPEGVGYSVEVPDIDGESWTQGETMEEAIIMAGDLIGTALFDELDFPKATPLKDIHTKSEDIKTIASVDINEYRSVHSKVVRKNVTVPEYLVEIGKRQGINFSDVLTRALKKEFDR